MTRPAEAASNKFIMLTIHLAKQAGDVPEPGDQWRGKVDTCRRNEAEMSRHRKIGQVCRSCAAACRHTEDQSLNAQEQGTETDQQPRDKQDRKQRLTSESRSYHQKLAHEYSLWRQSRYGHDTQ